jgi:hypothetical protein
MRISLPATTVRLQIAAAPTRTMRVSTKTSRPIPNQKSAKNSTPIIKAVARIAMLRWTTQIVMVALRRLYQNVQRRSRRRRNSRSRSSASAKNMGQKISGRFRRQRASRGSPECSKRVLKFREFNLDACAFLAFPLIARETLFVHSLESTPTCTIGWQNFAGSSRQVHSAQI